MYDSPPLPPRDVFPMDLSHLPAADDAVVERWLSELQTEHGAAVAALLGLVAASVGWRQLWFDLMETGCVSWSVQGDVFRLTLRSMATSVSPGPPEVPVSAVVRSLTDAGLLDGFDLESERGVIGGCSERLSPDYRDRVTDRPPPFGRADTLLHEHCFAFRLVPAWRSLLRG